MDKENQIQRYKLASADLQRDLPSRTSPYETVEMEQVVDLLTYWRVLRKRRWTVLTILFVLVTLVLVGTLQMTPIYRGKVLLEIQKENPDILSVQELFELDTVSDTYLETQYKILASDSLARSTIEELGLAQLEEFNPPEPWWSFGERERETPAQAQTFAVGGGEVPGEGSYSQDVLENFRDRLSIYPVKYSRLVRLSFDSKDPELAARVVNVLAQNYIERNLQARWEATQKATEWLSQQLLGLKVSLEKSEEQLQAYARQQGLLFLEQEAGNSENIINERLRRLQEELTRAQAVRYEKEGLFKLVENGEYDAMPGVADNRLMQDLTVTLAELQRRHAEMLSTFTPDYPKVKKIQNQIDEIEAVLERERRRAAKRITNEYQAAVQREDLLRQAFEVQREEANLIAERAVQYRILKREVETNKQLYEGLLQRMKEAGVSAGLKASNIRVVDPAVPPEKPAKPKPLLNLALATVLGLGLGVAAAFLQEYLDNTLKTTEDVERYLRVPSLALVPSVESLNGRGAGVYGLYRRGRLGARGVQQKAAAQSTALTKGKSSWFRIDRVDQQHSTLAEAFRSLRTSVLLSTAGHPPRSLLVSSSQPGEGKTTVSANLAICLGQLGQRVLLIDGDLRRPCVGKLFDIRDSLGLVSYLTGQRDWREAVQPTEALNLDVLVCGPIPPNPAELLSSDRMRTLLREVTAEYGFAVMDSAPLLNVADSRILATLVEGIVLVVKGGATPRELAQRAQTLARDVGGNVIGAVLNSLDVRADNYYYHRYYHYDYYGPRDEPRDRD